MDLNFLADKWPSGVVARDEFYHFSGGLIASKSLANLDSLGLGPEGAFRVGRKVAYPVANAIAWLECRATPRKA